MSSLGRAAAAGGLPRVEIARTAAEVDAARRELEELPLPQAQADPTFFMTVVDSRPEVERPHVVLARDGDQLVGAVVARLERICLDASIGYRAVYRPYVSAVTVVHGGVVAVPGTRALEALAAGVAESLRAGEADLIHFPSLRTDSEVTAAMSAIGASVRRQPFVETRTHRRLLLPPSFDAFLQSRSRNARSAVRRIEKKLEAAFPGELRLEAVRDRADVDALFRDLVSVADTTYQRALGAAFSDTPEMRALVELGIERGWFRAWVLYRGEEPIAFWQGTVYNRTYMSGVPGYRPEYRQHRVGIYVLMRAIADLCADPDVDVLDYGPGDAEYKRQFSSESWEERDLVIFAPTFRALRINAGRSAVLAGGRLAKLTAERLGVAERVKAGWRRRLADPGQESADGTSAPD